jgi:hypothetical protein
MLADGRLSDISSILKITQGGQGKEEEEDGDEEEEEEEEEEKLVALALLNIITAFS